MTTPATPPISLHDVAAELGISSVGLSLSDNRVRTLAGIPSGSISLHDLLGKSAYTPMSPGIGGDQSDTNPFGSTTFSLTCNPNGGVSPYTYSWAVPSSTGSGSMSVDGSSTGKSVTILALASGSPIADVFGTVQCTVTDATARVVASNVANLFYEWT